MMPKAVKLLNNSIIKDEYPLSKMLDTKSASDLDFS